jgi:hypothetical protein
LYGTLIQPVIILFFVYWLWHRFDISFDAIVKYFASGFFICTGMSIVYEMIASIAASMLLLLVSLLGAVGLLVSGVIDIDDLLAEDDDSNNIISGHNTHSIEAPIGYSISIALLTAFLNAFLVAALVEELCKYLCFWMVEHPDLVNDKVILSATMGSSESNVADTPTGVTVEETTKLHLTSQSSPSSIDQTIMAPSVSLETIGAATTVAMITVSIIIAQLDIFVVGKTLTWPLFSFQIIFRRPWVLPVLRISYTSLSTLLRV